MKQLKFFKTTQKAFGGSLLTKRKNRGIRPIVTNSSMHLVLRSSQAKGDWSLLKHRPQIWGIIRRFGDKYGIKIISGANAGNHLHLHIKVGNRFTYKPFIRAITAAIAMLVTGYSRWNKNKTDKKFWDRRPFSRVVTGRREFLTLEDYVFINSMESQGYARDYSRLVVEEFRRRSSA